MKKKFKVYVNRVYCVEHVVEADDEDHALEIACEISDTMPVNYDTYLESNWEANLTGSDSVVTYVPEQEYLL